RLPDVQLLVAGSYLSERMRRLASDAVRPIGFVEDLDPLFDSCRVFVAPLRYGAGMKGKIGQRMSLGVPVVTTTVGAEGLRLRNGVHALIEDSPEAFAAAVVHLYEDDALWRQLSSRSLSHVREHFSDEAARVRLERIFPVQPERAEALI